MYAPSLDFHGGFEPKASAGHQGLIPAEPLPADTPPRAIVVDLKPAHPAVGVTGVTDIADIIPQTKLNIIRD